MVPLLTGWFQLNHSTALTRGQLTGSWACRASVIQAAFEPPTSVEAVSAIMIGLAGASAVSAS